MHGGSHDEVASVTITFGSIWPGMTSHAQTFLDLLVLSLVDSQIMNEIKMEDNRSGICDWHSKSCIKLCIHVAYPYYLLYICVSGMFLRYGPQCSVNQSDCRIFWSFRMKSWNSLIFEMLKQILGKLKLIKKCLGGVGQFGCKASKLARSQERIDGINSFFACYQKIREA